MRLDTRNGSFCVLVGLLTLACYVRADVDCSKCLTTHEPACNNQACQTVDGVCVWSTQPDPETGEEINLYVNTKSFELVHLNNPKRCEAENTTQGLDCRGTKEYVCYKKVSYAGPNCPGGAECEEYATVIGCGASFFGCNGG